MIDFLLSILRTVVNSANPLPTLPFTSVCLHRPGTRLIFFACCLLTLNLAAQELLISGRVRDANTWRDIPGVNVYLKFRNIAVTSDAGGRFVLPATTADLDKPVFFEHVGYDTLSLALAEVSRRQLIYLQERVIPLNAVEVEAATEPLDIARDLPQTVTVLEARNFEMRGYIDAGDLLRTERSVQVDEVLSGRKTLSIRAGNADEVIVMYDGVKMNNAYDNVFDLSLVDLEDVQRFEIIKGSNTALYGSDAFSGVVNIVPKREQDYTLRFQQRFGTYASGNWGAHTYLHRGRAFGGYSYKQGGSQRRFSDTGSGEDVLDNSTRHQTASMLLDVSPQNDGRDMLSLNYVRAQLDYNNERFRESLLSFNQLLSARYSGRLWKIDNISISSAYQWLDDTRFLIDRFSLLTRDIDNRSLSLRIDKGFSIRDVEFLLGYQMEDTGLDFIDDRPADAIQQGVLSASVKQLRQGGVLIVKLHAPGDSPNLQTADFDVSLRYDAVNDKPQEVVLRRDSAGDSSAFVSHSWKEAALKFSAHLAGNRDDFAFNTFMNFGANVKFPTLFQQISAPVADNTTLFSANLQPEEGNSLEVGLDLKWDTREHPAIYGIGFTGSYFRNSYNNKFVSLQIPGSALVSYTNVKSAQIAGLEAATTVFLYRKKLSLDAGLSWYSIPELSRLAFPFKYDQKQTVGLTVDHAGYSLKTVFFHEGEQTGFTREDPQDFSSPRQEIVLAAASNVDVHLSTFLELKKMKLILNLSGRNLLKDNTGLEGLALRDRRYYLTLGAQY